MNELQLKRDDRIKRPQVEALCLRAECFPRGYGGEQKAPSRIARSHNDELYASSNDSKLVEDCVNDRQKNTESAAIARCKSMLPMQGEAFQIAVPNEKDKNAN